MFYQRIEFPGAWYRVMNRDAGRRQTFRTDAHRRSFPDLQAIVEQGVDQELQSF